MRLNAGTIQGLAEAVRTTLHAGEALVDVAERTSHSDVRNRAAALANETLELGRLFRTAPDNISGLGQALTRILKNSEDFLAAIEAEPEEAVRTGAASALGELLAAGREYTAAARGDRPFWKAAWDRVL